MTVTVTDAVALLDASGQPLVPEGRPLKATINQPSKLMEHPLEDGSSITDHRVFLPVDIELTLIVPFANFQRLRSVFRQSETVSVRTNSGTFESMVIESMPHDETPEVFDKIPVVLKLKEAQFVETQFQALPPRAAGRGSRNTSTVRKGQQSAKPAAATTERRGSVAYKKVYTPAIDYVNRILGGG